jgi:hypothetical protein
MIGDISNLLQDLSFKQIVSHCYCIGDYHLVYDPYINAEIKERKRYTFEKIWNFDVYGYGPEESRYITHTLSFRINQSIGNDGIIKSITRHSPYVNDNHILFTIETLFEPHPWNGDTDLSDLDLLLQPNPIILDVIVELHPASP